MQTQLADPQELLTTSLQPPVSSTPCLETPPWGFTHQPRLVTILHGSNKLANSS